MIYQNTLMPGIEYRIKQAANVTPQDLQHLIEQRASAYGISVSFKADFLASNRVFKLLGEKNEVVILFNPETNERLRYVLQFSRQGTYIFMQVNKTNGYAVDSSLFRGYEAGRSVFTESDHWYTIIDDIFNELFS